MGFDVVTVSTDSKHVHLAWREHEKELTRVAFPMGADPSGELRRMFGVWNVRLARRSVASSSSVRRTLMGIEVNFQRRAQHR